MYTSAAQTVVCNAACIVQEQGQLLFSFFWHYWHNATPFNLLLCFGLIFGCRSLCKRLFSFDCVDTWKCAETTNCMVSGVFFDVYPHIRFFDRERLLQRFCFAHRLKIMCTIRTRVHPGTLVRMVRMFESPYTNAFTMGSIPQKPHTRRPWWLRTLLVCSRL